MSTLEASIRAGGGGEIRDSLSGRAVGRRVAGGPQWAGYSEPLVSAGAARQRLKFTRCRCRGRPALRQAAGR